MAPFTGLQDNWLSRRMVKPLRDRRAIRRWVRTGRRGTPPPAFKQRLVLEYARRFRLRRLIETGTAEGDMVAACLRALDQVWSIELDPFACERAQRRFARHGHVRILQGDSGRKLPEVLSEVTDPCLVWLDGHAMVGGWRVQKLTPIREELEAILAHSVSGHVVLMDDVRLFDGGGDYPTLAEVRETILGRRPEWVVEVADDVLRAHPVAAG